jgi:hypothetical protein
MNRDFKHRLIGAALGALVVLLVAATVVVYQSPIVVPTIADMQRLTPHPRLGPVQVLGYAAPGDWGPPATFRAVQTNLTTTNMVSQASAMNTNWAFIHAWEGDVRKFGADSTGVSDSTEAIRAAIVAGQNRIKFPRGTFRISDTLNITGAHNISGAGAGETTIINYSPVPIFTITNHFIGIGVMEDFGMMYDQSYTNTTAVCVQFKGAQSPEVNDYWNHYYRRLRFNNAFHAFQLEDRAAVWSSVFEQFTTIGTGMTGPFIDFVANNTGGMPNNTFRNWYLRADNVKGYVIQLQSQIDTLVENIEVNRTGPETIAFMYLTANMQLTLRNNRMEECDFATDYVGVIRHADSINTKIDGLFFQTCRFNAPNFHYIFDDFTGGALNVTVPIKIERVQFRDCSSTGLDNAFVFSPKRLVDVDGWWSNNGYPRRLVYPFGATTNNVRQTWPQGVIGYPGNPLNPSTLSVSSDRVQIFNEPLTTNNFILTLPNSAAGVNTGLKFKVIAGPLLGETNRVTIRNDTLTVSVSITANQFADFEYFVNRWECTASGDLRQDLSRTIVPGGGAWNKVYRSDVGTTYQEFLLATGYWSVNTQGRNTWLSTTNDPGDQNVTFNTRQRTNSLGQVNLLHSTVTASNSFLGFGTSTDFVPPMRYEWDATTVNPWGTNRYRLMRLAYPATVDQTGLQLYDRLNASNTIVRMGTNGTGPGGVGRALYVD